MTLYLTLMEPIQNVSSNTIMMASIKLPSSSPVRFHDHLSGMPNNFMQRLQGRQQTCRVPETPLQRCTEETLASDLQTGHCWSKTDTSN